MIFKVKNGRYEKIIEDRRFINQITNMFSH